MMLQPPLAVATGQLVLCLVYLASEGGATVDDSCTDVSYWDVLKYQTTTKQCCKTKIKQICTFKSDHVCKDVPEIQCEVVSWPFCESQQILAESKKCQVAYQDYPYINCKDVKSSVTHTRKVPECKEVISENCLTDWKVDANGNKVWGGTETCTPVSWEECEIVEKQVEIPMMRTECSTGSTIKWADLVDKTKHVTGLETRCQAKSSVDCKKKAVNKCASVRWEECSMKPVEECQTVLVHKPSQEKIHRKNCFNPNIPGGGNGEQVCVGHNYGKDKCESIGCCRYEGGQCWSSVGTATCGQGPLDVPTVPGPKCNVKVTFSKKASPVSKYPLFTTVFGIPLMGSGISDTKFQHVASQLALWIDNDQDGCPDTPEVVTWLVKQKVVQWFGPGSDTANNRPDWDAIGKAGYKVGSALLFEQEINPSCSGTAQTNQCSDACIEEIWHVVTADGYAKAFPKVFSSSASSNSNLTKAMDVARGGRFTSVPSTYPSSAWYTYYDETCGYDCQAVEYIYWAVASYVGALDKRTRVIPEWRYNTKAKLIAGDKLVTALIQDKTKYRLPTEAPNGDYRGCSTCSTGVNHGGN